MVPAIRLLGVLTIALAVLSGGCSSTPPAPTEEAGPQTVRALKYKIFFLQDVRSWSGQWGHEIFFPDKGIVFNVTFEFPDFEESDHQLRPTVHAFPSEIRNRYSLRPHAEQTVAALEEIRVPAELAQEIFDFADLTRRQEEESLRIGQKHFELGNFPVTDPYLLKYEATFREIEDKRAAEDK